MAFFKQTLILVASVSTLEAQVAVEGLLTFETGSKNSGETSDNSERRLGDWWSGLFDSSSDGIDMVGDVLDKVGLGGENGEAGKVLGVAKDVLDIVNLEEGEGFPTDKALDIAGDALEIAGIAGAGNVIDTAENVLKTIQKDGDFEVDDALDIAEDVLDIAGLGDQAGDLVSAAKTVSNLFSSFWR